MNSKNSVGSDFYEPWAMNLFTLNAICLFPLANSVIYLDQKRNQSRVTEAAQHYKVETSLGNRAI